jgi:hypothetical protein
LLSVEQLRLSVELQLLTREQNLLSTEPQKLSVEQWRLTRELFLLSGEPPELTGELLLLNDAVQRLTEQCAALTKPPAAPC